MSHSRAPSTGNNSAGLSSTSQTNLASGNSPSLPGAFSFSTNSSPQSASFASTATPLKDSKFYKRSLVEDIEPTLRLDLAPGLSFLSRRTVLASLLQGSMVVEPFMPQTKFYGPIFACALCGEQRKADPYVRKHRFRTSEEESAQRYPLCDYCLGRTRAAGDFVGFLRMVRDGHWRAESEDEQKGAWEEAVRLRERMFWARQGGGVIPSLAKQGTPSTANMKSARQSLESIPEQETPARRASQAVQAVQAEPVQEPAQVTERELDASKDNEKGGPDEKLLDVFKSHRQSMSLGGNLVQASSEPPATTVLPGAMEPQEIAPATVSGSENVGTQEQAPETAVVAPVPEVKVQESALTEQQDVAVHPQPVMEVEEPEMVTEQTSAAILEPEPAQSVPSGEPQAVHTDRISESVAASEQPVGTMDAAIDPVTANQDDSAVAVHEEPANDAPIPVEETPTQQVIVDAQSTLQAPARPTERRGSSVLARVRAMESPKPPGSFD